MDKKKNCTWRPNKFGAPTYKRLLSVSAIQSTTFDFSAFFCKFNPKGQANWLSNPDISESFLLTFERLNPAEIASHPLNYRRTFFARKLQPSVEELMLYISRQ